MADDKPNLFFCNGWFYFKSNDGVFHTMVRGEPADRTRVLIPLGTYTNRNAAEQALPQFRGIKQSI